MSWFKAWRISKLEEKLAYAEKRVEVYSGFTPKTNTAADLMAHVLANPEIIRGKIAKLKSNCK